MRLLHAECDDAGGAVEQADELRCEEVVKQADQLRHDNGDENAEARAALGAVVLPGAEILPDKRGARHREACDGEKGEALDLAVRAVGRHREHAERVDLRLHDDVGKSDDAVLNAGGEAVANDLTQHIAVQADIARRDGVDLVLAQKVAQAEHKADRLGDDRCHRGGPDAPVERADEQEIKRDVRQRRDDKVVQGTAAVAERVERAGAHIVEHRCQHAEKVIAEIFHCLRHDLRVCVHPDEERRREQHAHKRQPCAGDDAEGEVCVDSARDVFVVARTEIFGDGNAGAHRRADKQAREQHDERAGRADGGEGVRAEKLADDEHVGRAVELLKNLADEDGQREAQNERDGTALGHVAHGLHGPCGGRLRHGLPHFLLSA